ncbi:hypothetical protein D0X99_13975 [Algoriphagus lacus]|uniref:Bacterial Pleckstrin homology domain-containing protein n=1 Tax=Algoriphagus lacus TaxID=2056311 RepID=A0A418PPC0_9BACT|nr:hypothetical protein [Algoriphagus lacus]RIW13928.1 hypothetical protein D0X99_13975 [Algoriphagus lacus]
MSEYVFKETQRFKQIWIWAVLVGVTAISLWELFFIESSKPTESWGKALPLVILFLVFALLLNLKLKIRIDSESLKFSFYPIIRERKYQFEDIDSMELIEYNGLLEYGGWGIKWNLNSWSYTTGGRHGILVKTGNKKFLLGTHKPEEAKKALEQFASFKSQSYGS